MTPEVSHMVVLAIKALLLYYVGLPLLVLCGLMIAATFVYILEKCG